MSLIIKKIEVQAYLLQFKQPFKTSYGVIDSHPCCVITIMDRQGLTGIGEAAPLPHFGMETFTETQQTLTEMSKFLIGQSIANSNDIWQLLASFSNTPAAKHGMELALLDLLANFHQIPLAKFLNHGALNSLEVNALIGAVAPELAATQAQKFAQLGYTCIKIKVGDGSLEQDWQRVKAVRDVGDRIKIRLDANQSWSVSTAIINLRELESLEIEYIEQPVLAEDLAGMAEVRRNTSIAIAADESVQNLAQLYNVIRHQAADIAIVKPMPLGGILAARQLVEVALQANLEAVITTTLDGAIARLGSLHLALSLPNIKRACGLATGEILSQDLPFKCPTPYLGKLQISSRSGLGYN